MNQRVGAWSAPVMEDDSTNTCVLDERWILRNFINDQVLEKLQLKMLGIIIKLNELWKLI